MKYAREDTVCLVTKVDGIKCTAVYTLEWLSDSCQASILTTFPRHAVVEGEFDLNGEEEPLDIIPLYVKEMFKEAGSQYAEMARQLTAYAIIVMDYCLERPLLELDELQHPSFDSIFATYESCTEASSGRL